MYKFRKVKGHLTGCGLHGYSLVSILFLTGQTNIAGFFLITHFCTCFKCLFSLLVQLFLFITVEQWRRKRELVHQSELIGGGSPRQLNTW